MTNSNEPGTTETVVVEAYDAGLLNDFGGGNVEWWQDYIRAELGRAHDFYSAQLAEAKGEVERFAGGCLEALTKVATLTAQRDRLLEWRQQIVNILASDHVKDSTARQMALEMAENAKAHDDVEGARAEIVPGENSMNGDLSVYKDGEP